MAPVRSTGAVVAVVSVSMALLSLFLYKSKPSSKKTELSLRSKENHNVLIFGCIQALESGGLAPGGVVTEGSAGSTAISLATVAPAYGCKCHVVIPDDAAIERSQILEALGATVERVRPVSITHREHFVNIARRRATEANELALKHKKGEQMDGQALEQVNGFQCDEEKQSAVSSYAGGYFADQFENLANFRAHYEGTGPEIWEQTGGNNNGLFLGSSSAMNCVGAVRAAQSLGPGHTIVTILCDSGKRHLSKFCSAEYLSQYGLTPSASGLEFLGVA
ncbi:unnamed protein product [Malus baccata var. baccata]